MESTKLLLTNYIVRLKLTSPPLSTRHCMDTHPLSARHSCFCDSTACLSNISGSELYLITRLAARWRVYIAIIYNSVIPLLPQQSWMTMTMASLSHSSFSHNTSVESVNGETAQQCALNLLNLDTLFNPTTLCCSTFSRSTHQRAGCCQTSVRVCVHVF